MDPKIQIELSGTVYVDLPCWSCGRLSSIGMWYVFPESIKPQLTDKYTSPIGNRGDWFSIDAGQCTECNAKSQLVVGYHKGEIALRLIEQA